jgi:ABC-2 type transport system ATP-binding protein
VDTPENLRKRLKKTSVIHVKLGDGAQRAGDIVSSIEGILMVKKIPSEEGTTHIIIEASPDRDVRNTVALALVESGLPLLEIYSEELSLEDIFLQLVMEEEIH